MTFFLGFCRYKALLSRSSLSLASIGDLLVRRQHDRDKTDRPRAQPVRAGVAIIRKPLSGLRHGRTVGVRATQLPTIVSQDGRDEYYKRMVNHRFRKTKLQPRFALSTLSPPFPVSDSQTRSQDVSYSSTSRLLERSLAIARAFTLSLSQTLSRRTLNYKTKYSILLRTSVLQSRSTYSEGLVEFPSIIEVL